jgi:hypothetical protein
MAQLPRFAKTTLFEVARPHYRNDNYNHFWAPRIAKAWYIVFLNLSSNNLWNFLLLKLPSGE